ncbi:MAG TPA: transposase [Terriglobia bacterium]|nr:transposase [Terriglobia bacterium]
MPIYGRHFEPGQLQFITTSTYRRGRAFTCQRFCWIFVQTLRQLRQETGFLLIGWVLMPEHFHLLIRPRPAEATVRFMQELKKRCAQEIIAVLARNQDHTRCRTLLARLRLPPPSTATRTIGWGRGATSLLTSLRRRYTWRNSTTCTTTPSRGDWSVLPIGGPGQASGFII